MKTTKKSRTNEEEYFDWLYHHIEDKQTSELKDFIYELYCFPFVCRIPNDDNREKDGLALRRQFAEEQNLDSDDFLSRPCTVLEMLIALSDRMDFVLFDQSKGSRMSNWFWLMVDNLKLQKYHNGEGKDVIRKKKYNRVVLKKFVNREYQADGRGGLFPLDNPTSDQREVEIWYQMMAFISQEYDD